LVLAFHLVGASFAAVAQPTGKVHRIGLLRHFACADQFGLKDLRQRLGELGYIEGRNIVIECRAAPGKWEELPGLAAELVRLIAERDLLIARENGLQPCGRLGRARPASGIKKSRDFGECVDASEERQIVRRDPPQQEASRLQPVGAVRQGQSRT